MFLSTCPISCVFRNPKAIERNCLQLCVLSHGDMGGSIHVVYLSCFARDCIAAFCFRSAVRACRRMGVCACRRRRLRGIVRCWPDTVQAPTGRGAPAYIHWHQEKTQARTVTYRPNYTVSQLNQAELFFFVRIIRQISTNFDNFWHKVGQDDKIYVRCTRFSPYLFVSRGRPQKMTTLGRHIFFSKIVFQTDFGAFGHLIAPCRL